MRLIPRSSIKESSKFVDSTSPMLISLKIVNAVIETTERGIAFNIRITWISLSDRIEMKRIPSHLLMVDSFTTETLLA